METRLVVPQKVKHRNNTQPSHPTFTYITSKNWKHAPRKTGSWLFITTLFPTVKKQRNTNVCQLMNGWKMWSLSFKEISECYSHTWKNEILTRTTKWMRIHSQKLEAKFRTIHATLSLEDIWSWYVHRKIKQIGGYQVIKRQGNGRNGSDCLRGMRFLLRVMKCPMAEYNVKQYHWVVIV